MNRVNAQATTAAAITANGAANAPGGTNVVLFLDSATGGTLKAVMPNGAIWTAFNTIEGVKFSLLAP